MWGDIWFRKKTTRPCVGLHSPTTMYNLFSLSKSNRFVTYSKCKISKANLRDSIAATGLVILLKLNSNHLCFRCMTFRFNGWPHKTIGQLFYAMSSFVHYFKTISEFRLELQSGNARFGSKSANWPRVKLKFDGWKTRAPLLCFVHHFIAIGQFMLELQSGNTRSGSKLTIFFPCDLTIWRMTLQTIRHLFYATPSFVHHFIAICEFKLE